MWFTTDNIFTKNCGKLDNLHYINWLKLSTCPQSRITVSACTIHISWSKGHARHLCLFQCGWKIIQNPSTAVQKIPAQKSNHIHKANRHTHFKPPLILADVKKQSPNRRGGRTCPCWVFDLISCSSMSTSVPSSTASPSVTANRARCPSRPSWENYHDM